MKDIVEYLSDMRWDVPGPIRQGALDEIDRLRAELATANAYAKTCANLANIREAELATKDDRIVGLEAKCERMLDGVQKTEKKYLRFMDGAHAANEALRKELAEAKAIIANLDERSAQYEAALKHESDCVEAAKARIAELETAGKELHACLTAMVDRWEPDTEGLDRVMWGNACEALGRDIWAHLKTT